MIIYLIYIPAFIILILVLISVFVGKVIAVDAKLNFDDNAKFRQKDIFAMEDITESDPREVQADKYNLNYIAMTGNIGYIL